MKTIVRRLALSSILLFAASLGPGLLIGAEAEKRVPGGVSYEWIADFSVDRLDEILSSELKEFSDFPMQYPSALNPVKLYRVRYDTVVPEQNNRPVRVSGLIAVPVVTDKHLPVLSYQHGTVFSRTEVPSFPEQSMETRMMVAAFAGHGYLVVAADYVGKGISDEPDGWLVKEVTAQACFDMLIASRAICEDMGLSQTGLFLSGWSQGSFSTSAFQQRLELAGIPITAAAMASAPNDIYLAINRWLHVPSEYDVSWLVATTGMLVFAYENYYGFEGLSSVAIRPEYLETVKGLYENRITWAEASKTLPSKCVDLLTEDFVARVGSLSDPFSQQLLANRSYNWRFKTPTRYYYGKIDEVVTPYMVGLPVEYQKSVGGAASEAIFAGDAANHRGTFVFAVKHQKEWFDSLRKP